MINRNYTFSFTKMHLTQSSGKGRPLCPGLNVLTHVTVDHYQINLYQWQRVAFYHDAWLPLLYKMAAYNWCGIFSPVSAVVKWYTNGHTLMDSDIYQRVWNIGVAKSHSARHQFKNTMGLDAIHNRERYAKPINGFIPFVIKTMRPRITTDYPSQWRLHASRGHNYL